MQADPFQKGKQMNRDERWEARRRAKLGMNAPDPNFLNPAAPSPPPPAPDPNYVPPSYPPPGGQMSFPLTGADYQPPSLHASVTVEPQQFQTQVTGPPASMQPVEPAYVPQYEPPQEFRPLPPEIQQQADYPPAARRQPTPPSNSFFVNPVSEAEQKRARLVEEYKRQMINDMNRQAPQSYQPEDRTRPASRGNIKMINPEQQQAEEKKRQYQAELQRQMQERQVRRKQQTKTPPQEYFPFGKPGAGAPFRDASGQIIAMRPPKFNENDPNYLKASEFYQKISDTRPQQGYPQASYNQSAVYPPSNAGYQMNPPASQGYPQAMNQGMMGNQMMGGQMMGNQMMGGQMMGNQMMGGQMGNQMMGGQMGNQMMGGQMMGNQMMGGPMIGTPMVNSQAMGQPMMNAPMSPQVGFAANQGMFNPQSSGGYQVYDAPRMQTPPEFGGRNAGPPPNPRLDFQPDQGDPAKEAERMKQMQLARDLQAQIEERERKRKEEREHKLREERYEEERIARQQRELQQEAEREAEARRKKFQENQDFNADVVVRKTRNRNIIDMPPYEPPQQPRRIRTPIEMPPAQQIDLPPVEPPKTIIKSSPRRHRDPENTHEVTRRVKQQLDSEMSRLKNEFHSQHNELKDAMIRLREETQQANEQRYEAQRELERLKEDIKQKNVQEELRQKELYQAVVSNPMPMVIPKTRMPPPDKAPLHLKRGFDEASLSLDIASKSLNGESKFIPLAKPDPVFPMRQVEQPNNRRAEELDGGFPSLPDMGPGIDTMRTANSSIGIDKINRRNEERLRMLEGVDPNDEIAKLDNLLLKYLDGSVPPKDQPRGSRPASKLASIKEEEDFNYSLPKSRGSGYDSKLLY